jgi:hypothetical protein
VQKGKHCIEHSLSLGVQAYVQCVTSALAALCTYVKAVPVLTMQCSCHLQCECEGITIQKVTKGREMHDVQLVVCCEAKTILHMNKWKVFMIVQVMWHVVLCH